MDNLTFEKADALKTEINNLRYKIKYFREPYEFCVMTYQEKEEIRKAKTFKAKLRIILKNEKPFTDRPNAHLAPLALLARY